MNSRRDFLKKVTGQPSTIREEIRREEKIPLNRLNELPDNIIEMIEPVLFPQGSWKIVRNTFYQTERNTEHERHKYVLGEYEDEIFRSFKEHKCLKIIAKEITIKYNLPYSLSYEKVTSLFFNLAAMRICHPREAYNIDKLSTKIINPGHGQI